MIVTCPSCHTRYRLDPAALGPNGRTVRCSGCAEHWFIEPPEQAKDPPPLTPPSMAPPPAPNRRGGWAWTAVTVIALLLAGLTLARNEIVALQPATAAIYQRFGLPVEMALGLEFRRLASQRHGEDLDAALVITGEVANVSGQPRTLPPIEVGLLDRTGRELSKSRFDPPQPLLEADASADFTLELPAPSAEASDFRISFADPS